MPLILGIVLLILSAVLLIARLAEQRMLRALRGAEPVTARDLAALAGSVGEELGEVGRFRQIAEVSGVVRCETPLTSEVTGQPCVYYETVVTREYESPRPGRHSRRRSRGKARRQSEVVARSSRQVPFWVEDATGRVLVDPGGAQIDPVQASSRFESVELALPGAAGESRALSVEVSRALANPQPGTRTLGFRTAERIVPVGQRVYVLGEASDSSGELAIRLPGEPGRRFVISTRSKEELMRSSASAARWLLLGAAGSGGLGIALIVARLLA